MNGEGGTGSVNRSASLYRSDINSDFVINNAFTIQNDLEHVNLVQMTDTNGFIRRVYILITL